jgi:hypothetical protein
MEISIEKLTQLSKTSARAKVMIKQWYPDLFKDNDTIEIPIDPSQNPRSLGYSQVLSGMTLRDALRRGDTRLESVTDTTSVDLQLGKWYTDGQGHLMIFTGNTNRCAGFFGNSWGTMWSFSHITSSRLATEQEIGDALRRYCRHNGYTSINFESLATCTTRDFPIEDWYYSAFEDALYAAPEGRGGLCVYKQGIWAQLYSQIAF